MTAETSGTTRSLASWWRGRFGRKLLVEILICGSLLVIYRAIRMVNRTDLSQAFTHAREVLRFEEWLGLPFEDDLQGFLLGHPTLIKLLNHYYIWFHFPAAIGLLLWLYLRHHDRYHAVRNLMAFVTFAALIIHLAFPLAPPRMMSGFVDTMRQFGPSIYPANAVDGAANQIAAMPSLHFAWAMIEALAVVSVLKSRWRWLIVIHPVLMTLSIIATANHWWIDAAAAAVIVLLGIGLWRLVQRWARGRRWSWTKWRFEAASGIKRLESFANEPTRDRAEI
ncbi:MAG TPA: phosphatase PAP2 family protein [Ilumatobacter sp.]